MADLIAAQRVQTSFDRGITRFTWLMLTLILVMAPTVFLINGLTKGNWFEALLFAVAVAVGLTPEMLPMIVTVNLAKGAIAMSRKKVIVKRLNAIQNFGAMDVLCTDKTGTLTQDRIILKHHLDLRGEESDQVLEYAFLNSFYQSGLKNLLDISVLKHVELEQRLDVHARFRKIDELPFDFERRRMSVVLERSDGSHVLICKGAVEEVLGVSSSYASGDELGPLESGHLEHAKRMAEDLNSDGFRAVAVAYKELPQQQSQYAVADESDLILLGFIAFLDPPRDTAAEALSELKTSGVAVKILTGDNAIVARKICREVGLDGAVHHVAGSDGRDGGACLGVRQGVARAEGGDCRGTASQGARCRLHGGRHQRRAGAQGGRRRHLGGQRRRHRQGIRRHHPA